MSVVRRKIPLALDLGLALDATGLFDELGMVPDPWQRELLERPPHRALLNCCRQSGKSTTAAVLALHHALFRPEVLILLLSPSMRQSAELFRKIVDQFHRLRPNERPPQESVLRMEMSNGSRIISLPGSEGTIRGYSVASLVIVDEAARVSDELLAAIRPTLATTDGDLIAMSTPYGRRGWWFKAWTDAAANWKRFTLTAPECGRISKEFLDEELKTHGEWIFKQEYLGEFVDDSSSLFMSSLIEAALSDEVKPLFGGK